MYITFYEKPKAIPEPATPELNFDSLLNMILGFNTPKPTTLVELNLPNLRKKRTAIVTAQTAQNVFDKFFSLENIKTTIPRITMPVPPGTPELYREFKIPKRSDPKKYRTLCEPVPELKIQQRLFADYITHVLHVLPHEAAHAYVEGRSNLSFNQVHQRNESRFSLKLDMKDFFPSFNLKSIMDGLHTLYPFCILLQDTELHAIIEQNIKYCLHKNKLPQGTPLSPMLTNLLMVPIDMAITTQLRDFNRHNFIYTRYADDMEISCKYKFDYTPVIGAIKDILVAHNAPFRINDSKTKMQNVHGKNWSVGLMRNSNGDITVGHRNKQKFRAMINNCLQRYKAGNPISRDEAQHCLGIIAYYRAIEPDYVNHIIARYGLKAGVSVMFVLKQATR